jgi:hypothetical protein
MTNGDRTGGLGTSMEAQNSVITSLQDEETWSKGTVKILGDPDYLMRDSVTSITEFYNKFYGTDGYTISAHGGQVFIEIAFKEAVDYENSTGLMKINDNILFLNYPDYIKEMANGAVIWEVTEVVSNFTSGSFTQNLSLIGTSFDAGGSPTTGSGGTGGTGDGDGAGLENLDGTELQGSRLREGGVG